MSRSLAVAEHEAAHAVVGVWLGLSLRVVRLDPDDVDYDGLSYFADRKKSTLEYAIMCAAGPAADAIRGRNEPEFWMHDFELIRRKGFVRSERVILVDMATRYLNGPCRSFWSTVTERLLERDLMGSELKSYILYGEKLEP